MSYRSWIAAALLAACLFINPSSAIAQMPVSGVYWPQTPATMKAEHRAGYSQSVSPIAMESYNEHYSGGYIGGGTLFGRHGRTCQEGTWGWDYSPLRSMSPQRFLGWSHGRRYQGGTGSYRTDGPKPIEHVRETIHEHFSGGE